MKAAGLAALKSLGGFGLARALTGRSLRILCYHGIWTEGGPPFGECLFIAPDVFEQRMARLARSGYPVLDLAEAVEALYAGTLPRNAVVITIDDGWRSTRSHMLPVLRSYGLPATLYVSTYYAEKQAPVVNVALRYILERTGQDLLRLPEQIAGGTRPVALASPDQRETACDTLLHAIEALPSMAARAEALLTVADAAGFDPATIERQFTYMDASELSEWSQSGLRLELHTHRHTSTVTEAARLAREIDDNRASLRKSAEGPFQHFCYPSGEHDGRADGALTALGIRSATTTRPGLNRRSTPRFRLNRFLDGPRISEIEFDAYLAGALEPVHYLKAFRARASHGD